MSDIRTPETHDPHGEHPKRGVKLVAGGSSIAALAGTGAVVLAILGLLGIIPFTMLAVSTIAVGAAFFFHASALGARARQLLADASGGESGQLVGGMSVEGLGAAAGVALGTLALIGIVPEILLPVAAIALGGSLLVGASATQQLNELTTGHYWTDERTRQIASQSINSVAGIQILVGATGVVLGILALLEIQPMTLTLIAMLVLGGGMLLIGGGVSGALGAVTRR